jgi:hypothetical protein
MLTAEQQARLEQLVDGYERDAPPLSFADYMTAQGDAELLAALEATLQARGDTATLQQLHAEPITPELIWQQTVAEFDAPLEGGPWALDNRGKWFEVQVQPPGAQVGEYQGRSIYIPPEHPSTRVKESGGYGGTTDNVKRWTEQKFRMARAALLGPRPFYNLFFRVAPRGGNTSAGRAFQSEGRSYSSEGGELYPDLSPSDPKALELNNWWRLQDFGGAYTGGYPWGQTLNWLRVYTGSDGYRHYKPWSSAEAREFFERWYLAVPGYVCRPDEIERAIADTIGLQQQRQGAQTEGDYSLHWAWPIGPLSQCEVRSSERRMENVRKAAAIAAIVVTIIYAPAIALKLKAFAAKIGPKIAAAAKAAGSSIGSAVLQKGGKIEGEDAVRAILTSPETREAIQSGELPPAPTSTADPAWQTYATTVAEWYMQRQLAEQREQIVDAEQRRQAEAADADWLAQRERELRLEVDRARRSIENVAADAVDPDAAADRLVMAGPSNSTMLAVLGVGLAAALTLGGLADNANQR